MDIGKLNRNGALNELHRRCRELERHWAHPDRGARIDELRELLRLAGQRGDLAFTTLLADQLDAGMSERGFLNVCIPIERETSRIRLRDEDLLHDADDRAEPAAPAMPVTVIADNLRSAFNIGGLFRSAECFGCTELLLTGYSATPEHPQVRRAAMGTDGMVGWRRLDHAAAALDELAAAGTPIIALETSASACALHDYRFPFPCALVLGNERFGIDPDILARADAVVRIPLAGRKNSLNVVSAFTVCAHEIRRQWESHDTS